MTIIALAPGQQIKARGLRGVHVVVQPFLTGTPPHLVYEARHHLTGQSRIIRAEHVTKPRLRGRCPL